MWWCIAAVPCVVRGNCALWSRHSCAVCNNFVHSGPGGGGGVLQHVRSSGKFWTVEQHPPSIPQCSPRAPPLGIRGVDRFRGGGLIPVIRKCENAGLPQRIGGDHDQLQNNKNIAGSQPKPKAPPATRRHLAVVRPANVCAAIRQESCARRALALPALKLGCPQQAPFTTGRSWAGSLTNPPIHPRA